MIVWSRCLVGQTDVILDASMKQKYILSLICDTEYRWIKLNFCSLKATCNSKKNFRLRRAFVHGSRICVPYFHASMLATLLEKVSENHSLAVRLLVHIRANVSRCPFLLDMTPTNFLLFWDNSPIQIICSSFYACLACTRTHSNNWV
jgi:hypothetical protein